ncbi:unnamed protein product [Prunus armeniaca]|uniref:Uncharacterized protein n=1 Tax=Prunus armeniaca TaxID=36596 RepID=A0A6J5VQ97_PRUAR|nr:unnamed protein product [Prunus armeniaca]
MSLLFHFVEALKKNVYNAYEGSAVLLSATRSSSLLFRANKKELRNLVASALNEKSRSQVTENLHNIRGRFLADILRVLRHMALDLCKTPLPFLWRKTGPSAEESWLSELQTLRAKHAGKSYCGALTTTGSKGMPWFDT